MTKKDQLKQLLRDQYFAQNPQAELRDILETQKLIPLIEKFLNEVKIVTPISGKDYFTEGEKAVFYSALFNDLRAAIKDGSQGPKGDPGDPGKPGKNGNDGYTPVRGVDYFTKSDVDSIVADVLKKIPKVKIPVLPDVGAIVKEHVTDATKDIPTNDSVVGQILKHPLLRVMLHGGGGGSSTTFIDDEVVAGSGTAWTLANTPIAGSLKLYALGQRLKLTTDYSIIGKAITTISSWNSGEILADYRIT